MEINKNVVKKSRTLLFRSGAVVGLALAFTGGAYVAYNQVSNVQANQDNVTLTDEQVAQKVEQVKNQAVNGSILISVFEALNNAVEDGTKLSQTELDGYTYYMLVYRDSNQTFYGTDAISSPDAGFKLLLTLYEQSGIEPSFNYTSDGETIVLKRDIVKPESFDSLVQQVESEVEDKLDDENIDLSDSKTDLGVPLESKDLVE